MPSNGSGGRVSIGDDLAGWLATQPSWQQQVVAAMCRGEHAVEADIKRIADDLVAGTAIVAQPVKPADIPGASVSGTPVRVSEVEIGSGINNLADGQRVTFAPDGLTIVYGFNGGGKSGYARLLRRAVSARVEIEILPDVFHQGSSTPRVAKIGFVAEGKDSDGWELGTELSAEPAQVRFYDSECGQAYLNLASETIYRPSALVYLEGLARTCDRVAVELRRRLADVDSRRGRLPRVDANTAAGRFLATLTSATSAAEIGAATVLPGDFDQQLAAKLTEQARLEASDPAKEQARLRGTADALTRISAYCADVEARVGAAGVVEIRRVVERATELRLAARVASQRTFETEPVAGVGTSTWRALWAAAAGYSETEAYPEQPFPVTTDGAHCVLCQQALSFEGADRLDRFMSFMTDTTEHAAAIAENELAAQRAQLAALSEAPYDVQAALRLVDASEPTLAEAVITWLTEASRATGRLMTWLNDPVGDEPACVAKAPSAAVDTALSAMLQRANEIDAPTFAASLDKVRAEGNELRARKALADASDAIQSEVRRLVQRRKLEFAQKSVETGLITRMVSALTEKYVTAAVAERFATEVARYGIGGVVMSRAGGKKGVVTLKPEFDGVKYQEPINRVLSEGEQTALGLAGFLTEVHFEVTKSAVILDDPVSSLDHANRERGAGRLVELAADRQVIVFTHDIAFVAELKRQSAERQVSVCPRTISRRGAKPGFCLDFHPWTVLDVDARISKLDQDLQALHQDRDGLLDHEYEERAAAFAGYLSEAWERMVHAEVVAQVVDVGSLEVKPSKFRLFVKIKDTDDAEFQTLYYQTSKWAHRHDNHPETIYTPPTVAELYTALENLRTWRKRIRGYRN